MYQAVQGTMDKKESIILVGGGGHCKSVINVIEKGNRFEIAGIIDKAENVGKEILGYSIIGTDTGFLEKGKLEFRILITVGHIKNVGPRASLFKKFKQKGFIFPVIQSPTADVCAYSVIGEGTVVFGQAFVNAGVQTGKNCILNTGSIVEHETTIGDHTQVSTGAIVNGQCNIGSRCFVGSGSVVNNNVNICDDVVIGSGSVVRSNILNPGVYAGNPLNKLT